MRNGADIAYRENIRLVFENDLDRMRRGTHTGRETEKGVKMAIAYLDSLKCDVLDERQLYHAVRLAHYRGKATDYRKIVTVGV